MDTGAKSVASAKQSDDVEMEEVVDLGTLRLVLLDDLRFVRVSCFHGQVELSLKHRLLSDSAQTPGCSTPTMLPRRESRVLERGTTSEDLTPRGEEPPNNSENGRVLAQLGLKTA